MIKQHLLRSFITRCAQRYHLESLLAGKESRDEGQHYISFTIITIYQVNIMVCFCNISMNDKGKEISPAGSNPLSKSLLKVVLIAHFVLIAIYTVFVLHTYAPFPSGITLFTLILYGCMGGWLWVLNYMLVVAGCQPAATVLNRLIVKFIMFLFPLFALLSMSNEPQFQYPEVHIWMLYMGVACLALIIYEVVTCLCYSEEHPDFIFRPNDLEQPHETIYARRAEYNQFVAGL